MNLKTLIAASIIAVVAPIAALSATLTPGNNNVSDTPLEFDVDYDPGDGPGTIDFVIINDTAFDAVFSVASGTVQQFTAFFDADVVLTWLGSGESDSVAGGQNDVGQSIGPITSLILGSGESDTLRLSFGAVQDVVGDFGLGRANIDFDVNAQVAPVPVPAGILLMGTALAGFGVMRRRKKRA